MSCLSFISDISSSRRPRRGRQFVSIPYVHVLPENSADREIAHQMTSIVSSFFFIMALHSGAQAHGQKEIDAVTNGLRLPTFADRPALPYIECLLKKSYGGLFQRLLVRIKTWNISRALTSLSHSASSRTRSSPRCFHRWALDTPGEHVTRAQYFPKALNYTYSNILYLSEVSSRIWKYMRIL